MHVCYLNSEQRDLWRSQIKYAFLSFENFLIDISYIHPSINLFAFLPPTLAILIRRRDARRTVGWDRSVLFHVSSSSPSSFHPPPYSLLTLVSLTLDILPLPLARMYTRTHSLRLPLKETWARIESPLVYRVFAASATLSTRADEPSNIESGDVIEFALVSMRADRKLALKGGALRALHCVISFGPHWAISFFTLFF